MIPTSTRRTDPVSTDREDGATEATEGIYRPAPNFSERGVCAGHPDAHYWTSDDYREVELAKMGCDRCPIKDECYTWAKLSCEEAGVWGGVVFGDPPPLPPVDRLCKHGHGNMTQRTDGRPYCRECNRLRRADQRKAA